MKFTKILEKYYNRESPEHKRKFGIYWASDLYPIMKGWLTDENFYDTKKINLSSAQMMATGEAMEAELYKILSETNIKFDYQVKKQINFDDGTSLVCKTDFVLKDCIIETKFPFSKVDTDIPERYCYQLEAYYRAFKKPVYLGVLSIPLDLTTILYIPSAKRWDKIQKVLKKFTADLKGE